jgi:hypothetical protein
MTVVRSVTPDPGFRRDDDDEKVLLQISAFGGITIENKS